MDYSWRTEKGLLQNAQLVQRPVIPRKTAARWAAVFRGNPPLLPGKRIATPVCALARNDRLVQNSYFATGPAACRKSLAEFAPAGANKVKSVFSRDLCVDENTSQAASVGPVRLQRTGPARGRLHPPRKSGVPLFRQSPAAPASRGGRFLRVRPARFPPIPGDRPAILYPKAGKQTGEERSP